MVMHRRIGMRSDMKSGGDRRKREVVALFEGKARSPGKRNVAREHRRACAYHRRDIPNFQGRATTLNSTAIGVGKAPTWIVVRVA